MKILAVLLLIAIICALGSAMLSVVRNKGEPEKTVRALTLRVVLSVGLFICLFIAYKFGWIHPHRVS